MNRTSSSWERGVNFPAYASYKIKSTLTLALSMCAHWEGQVGVDRCIALGTMHTRLASVTVMKNFGQSRSDGNSRLPVTSSYSRQASAHTSQAAWVLPACSVAACVVLLAASSISGDLTHSVPRFLQQHIQVHGQPWPPELQRFANSCCLQMSSICPMQPCDRSKQVCDMTWELMANSACL